MKIAYIGNFRPFWSTENHVALSLEELGYEVVRLQENQTSAEAVLETIQDAGTDLLLWTRTWGIEGDGFGMLERVPCPSVAFHLDLYAGLERAKSIDAEPWWRCDYVFTADGGSDPFWREHGVNHHWSPPGVYGKECYLADPDPALVQDVIFVGSYHYHREWPYRPLLIDNLRAHYGDRFTLYDHSSGMRGHKLNVLYASARVVVGDSCCLGFDHTHYWSDRIPETPGRGGFLIHPHIEGLDWFFRDDRDMVFYEYNDWDGLFWKIDYYLGHPIEREQIRLAGHEKIKGYHTYVHRLRDVLAIVERGRDVQ